MAGRRRRWTDEQLSEAVQQATSIFGVFRVMGLKVGGGQHALIKQHIERLGLDTSHFRGQGWSRGLRGVSRGITRSFEEILVEDSTYHNTVKLKQRLVREGLLRYECFICHLSPSWNGQPLVLRLDHVNGNRVDNRLENLRIVCPNCDSQLSTFAGRNKRKPRWRNR